MTLNICVTAQDSSRLAKAMPSIAIRFSPFHLIGFYPTAQAGVESRIGARTSLYLEGGYALNIHSYNEDFLNKRGFKLKLEPRYYLSVNRKGNVLWYVAGELYHNHINFDRKESRTECYDLDCQQLYRRRYLYKATYRENGFGFKGGIMIGVKRFFFDFSSGFAIRYVDYDLPVITRDFVNDEGNEWWDIPNETDRTAVMPLVGIRMGYRIRK